jgi:hypothetical protein
VIFLQDVAESGLKRVRDMKSTEGASFDKNPFQESQGRFVKLGELTGGHSQVPSIFGMVSSSLPKFL